MTIVTFTGRKAAIDTTMREAWAGPTARAERSNTAATITVDFASPSDAVGQAGAQAVLVEYADVDGYYRFGVCAATGGAGAQVIQQQASGTGNSTVLAPVLDGNGAPTASSGIRSMRAYVLSTGAVDQLNGSNVGDITVKIGTRPQTVIPAGKNMSLESVVHSPRGFAGIVLPFGMSADKDERGLVHPAARPWGRPLLWFAPVEAANGVNGAPLTGHIRIGSRADFLLLGQQHTGGQTVSLSTSIQLALLPNSDDVDPRPELQPPELG